MTESDFSKNFEKWVKAMREEHEELERLYGPRPWKPGSWAQNVDSDFTILRIYFRDDCNGLCKWINHKLTLEFAGENDDGTDDDAIGGIQIWDIEHLLPNIDWRLEPLDREETHLLDLWDGEIIELVTDEEKLKFSNEMITTQIIDDAKDHGKCAEIFKVGDKTKQYPGAWYCYGTDSLIFNFEEKEFWQEPVNQFLTLHWHDNRIVGCRLDYASRLNREIRNYRDYVSNR